MKKVLLLAVILTCLTGYAQERKKSIDKLTDGWYQTHGVANSELGSINSDNRIWVYVKNQRITSLGQRDKARNITNGLQRNIDGENLFNKHQHYISGGFLNKKTLNNERFFVAEIFYEIPKASVSFKKRKTVYYSIKI